MFEVRIFVLDKNLPNVMWALDGIVAGMPTVIPVRDAKERSGVVVSTTVPVTYPLAKKPTNHLVSLRNPRASTQVRINKAIAGLLALGKDAVTTQDLEDILSPLGWSGTSKSQLVGHLRENGYMKSPTRNEERDGKHRKVWWTYPLTAKLKALANKGKD